MEQQNVMKKTKAKLSKKFWIIYFITVILALGLISGVLVYLWDMLEAYELGTPEHTLSSVDEIILAEDYDTLMSLNNYEINYFEDKTMILPIIKNNVGTDVPEYVKNVKKSTDDVLYYGIRTDGEVVGEIMLSFEDDDRFGSWTTQEITYNVPTWGGIEIIIPDSATLFINDKEVDENYMTETNIAYEELDRLPENVTRPFKVRYVVDSLTSAPDIKVVDQYGNELQSELTDEFTVNETATQKIFFVDSSETILKENLEDIESMVIRDAEIYSNYISLDTSFYNLAERLNSESKIYRDLRGMEVYWYIDHRSVQFSEPVVSNIVSYNPELFSADIDYLYSVYGVDKTNTDHHFETKLTLFYYKDGEEWIIGDINIR